MTDIKNNKDSSNDNNNDNNTSKHSSQHPHLHKRLKGKEALQANKAKKMTKVMLVTLVGAGLALFANSHNISNYIAQKNNQETLEPQVITGKVVKTLEDFSLVSNEGGEYHIFDPNSVLDDVVKEMGEYHANGFYELDQVHVKGIISKVGNYGHMGRYEREITVISANL